MKYTTIVQVSNQQTPRAGCRCAGMDGTSIKNTHQVPTQHKINIGSQTRNPSHIPWNAEVVKIQHITNNMKYLQGETKICHSEAAKN